MGGQDLKEPTALPAAGPGRDGTRGGMGKPRLLLLLVIDQAAPATASTAERVPPVPPPDFDVEMLVIDDAPGGDATDAWEAACGGGSLPFPLRVVRAPARQGFGGCLKLGFYLALQENFDAVAVVPDGGRPAPEALARMAGPIVDGTADVVLGSRVMEQGGAGRNGGLPILRSAGIRILAWAENLLLGVRLSEMHSGHRVYTVSALRLVPFALNSNGLKFDTEIILQFLRAGLRIAERPVPAGSVKPSGPVAWIRSTVEGVGAALSARLTDLNITYDRKFDCRPARGSNAHYQLKAGYASTHSLAIEAVPVGARVVDLGCAGGQFGRLLKERRQARVTGVDVAPLDRGVALDAFVQHDLNGPDLPVLADGVDVVLMLDVIEHLQSPERFVDLLRDRLKLHPGVKLIVSTGNVAFIVTRLLHLCGVFAYGKKGILDMTHTRLFTFGTLGRLFEEAGFDLVRRVGVPAPWPLVFGEGTIGRFFLWGHGLLCRMLPSLFAYQIFMEFRPQLHPAHLLASLQRRASGNQPR